MQFCAYLHGTVVCHWQRLNKCRIHGNVGFGGGGAQTFGEGANPPPSQTPLATGLQRLELFGNRHIFAPSNRSGTRTVYQKAPSRYILQTVQDTFIVTMEDEKELVRDLSNGAISNDLA